MTNQQQNTIREMASKKLLTGEQKKVLYRLFDAKIDIARSQYQTKSNQEENAFGEELIKKAQSNKSIIAIVENIKKAHKVLTENEKALKDLGLEQQSNYNSSKLELRLTYSNKEIQKFRDANREKYNAINELKVKLLSDIYCLPLTAQEMTAHIDNEIKQIMK